ncbi:FecCD family ABC transporter permease [Pseudohaliea rubra]|nr:iron chelate uptake ABC transporter family permease subunit [Pseudohaliea rubra]
MLPAALASLALGAVPLGPSELAAGLTAALAGDFSDPATTILARLRLPRTLLASSMGAILALCGAVSQGLFRNPLADPSLIGVTGGATLGAAAAMVLGAGALPALPVLTVISFGAFAGGVAAVLLVYRLATDSTGTSVATMLLAGIAITALAGALVSLVEFYADNALLRRISLWKMGGLETGSRPEVVLALAVTAVLCVALPRHGTALNALLLGESEAAHLGIRVGRLKAVLVTWIALGVGVSVALAGTIAFVGLVVPHVVRLAIGPDHRYLLPGSALAGAILLLLADTAARLLAPPAEIPVGILTAIVGVPFFLSLLRQRARFGMVAP